MSAAAATSSAAEGVGTATTADFTRWDANTIVEALLWMNGRDHTDSQCQESTSDGTTPQVNRSATPVQSSVGPSTDCQAWGPQLSSATPALSPERRESLGRQQVQATSEPAPQLVRATSPRNSPLRTSFASVAPLGQDETTMLPYAQTPTNRHTADTHTRGVGVKDESKARNRMSAFASSTSGEDCTGLVSSAAVSRGATTTPVSHHSLPEGQTHQAAAHYRAPPAAQTQRTPPTAANPLGSVSAGGSTALSTDVGGVAWQRSFVAHAQELLWETRQQIDELRRYKEKSLQEARRADSLAAANCRLEAQLTGCASKRAEERVAHECALTSLSQQVLLLEAALGERGRSTVELQRELQTVQATLAQQEEKHQRELQQVRDEHDRHVEQLVAEHDLQRAQWREQQRCLGNKLIELESGGTTLSTHQTSQDTCCAERGPPCTDEALAVACEGREERTVAVTRLDAATSMDEMRPLITVITTAATPPPEKEASPTLRTHGEGSAHQQSPGQAMVPQLSMFDASPQEEESMRRHLAEDRVAQLLVQNASLRRALASANTAAASTTPVTEPAGKDISVSDKACRDGLDTTVGETHDVEDSQHKILQEIRNEYTALRRESAFLLSRHQKRQQREKERWASVRSALCAALNTLGLRDAQCALEAAGTAVTSALHHDSGSASASSDVFFYAVLTALDNLVVNVRSQQEAARDERQQLSTLEAALRTLETRNQAHIASLDATKAELYHSQRELESWKQCQQELAARHEVQSKMYQSAKAQLKEVTGVLRRASHEFLRPLRALSFSSSSTASLAVEDGASEAIHGSGQRVVGKGCSPSRIQRPHSSPIPSTSPDGIRCSYSNATPEPTAADTTPVSDCEEEAHAAMMVDDSLDHAAPPHKVSSARARTVRRDTVGVSARRSLGRAPHASDARRTPSSISPPHVTDERRDTEGDAEENTLDYDMTVLRKVLQQLLRTWSRRQHTLVEAAKTSQRRVSALLTENRSLLAKQRQADARRQQQIRLSRAAAQSHTHQLEQAQREVEELQLQVAREGALARQKAGDWEGEREILRRRIRVAEEQVNRAEQALVEADVSRKAESASHDAQARALSDVTAARDRLERRQADLCEHVEDLETQLLAAERTQKTLHALLTSSVAFVVALLAGHQQLQDHYRVSRTLAAVDAQTTIMVEHVLSCSWSSSDEQTAAEGGGKRPTAPTETAGRVSAWPAVRESYLIAPASRFRALVHAVRVVWRLSRFLAARQRLRSQLGTRRRDEALPLAAGTAAAAAATPATLQPLLTSLSFCAFKGSAAAPVPSGAMAPPHHPLLQLYTTGPDLCTLPVVHLPPPLELASLVSLDTPEAGTGKRGDDLQVRFNLGSCTEEERKMEGKHMGAEHHRQQQQLVQLLSIAKLDVQAPTTQYLCAKTAAASSVSTLAATELLHLLRMRQTFSGKLGMSREKEKNPSIPAPELSLQPSDLRLLLPGRVATLLQMKLEQTTARSRRLAESDLLQQQLVEQNNKLITTLNLRTAQYNTVSAELQSLASQLELRHAAREEQTAAQERLIETRTALLRERKLRREAEDRLAELQLARLQWLGEQELYKREVYALNMELANTSVSTSSPALALGHVPPAILLGGGAGPATKESALAIEVNETTATDTSGRLASSVSQRDPPSGSTTSGVRVVPCHGDYRDHPPALHGAPAVAQVDNCQSNENYHYYYELLRGGHQQDDDDAEHFARGSAAKTESRERKHSHRKIPPLPLRRCGPRGNLPTLQSLTENTPALENGLDDAVAASGGGGKGVGALSTSLWNTQSHSDPFPATAGDVSRLPPRADADVPPTQHPLQHEVHLFQLYVPKVARHREKGCSSAEQACDASGRTSPPLGDTSQRLAAEREIPRSSRDEPMHDDLLPQRSLWGEEILEQLQLPNHQSVEPKSSAAASAPATFQHRPQEHSSREKSTLLDPLSAPAPARGHDHRLDGPGDTVVDASELSAVTTPLIELQPPSHDVSSSARRNEDGFPTLSRGGDQCGGGASLATALQFSCCRCRRPMVVHPGMHHSAAPASLSDKPQGHTPIDKTDGGHSNAACAAGSALDIHDLPIANPSRDDRLARHGDDGDALAHVPAAEASTDASQGFEAPTPSTVANPIDEALLKALPPFFFESAELLSLTQLSDLILAAQGSSFDVTPATSSAEHASVDNRPPTSLPPSHTLSIAAPYSEAAATPAVPAVLDVSQLASLGVPVQSSTNRNRRGAKDEQDVLDEGETPGVVAHLAQGSSSATAAHGDSQHHATAPDKYSGESTVTEPRARPPLGAPSAGTLPLPPTLPSHAEGAAGEKSATRSCNASGSPCISSSHPPRVDDSCADPALLHTSTSYSTSPSQRPPPRSAPSLTPLPEQGIVAAAPADELLEALPFDELCRRWMRLVAQTAVPHEQPLCMSCWRGTYIVPLQQRTQRALEGIHTLASMASGTREEMNRLFTLCYSDPATTPLRGAVVTPGGPCRGPGDVEKRRAMDTKVAAENLPQILPRVSLDAVAANLFGPNEEDLLNSLDALSAPHRRVLSPPQESLAAPGPSQCLCEIPLEPQKAAEAGYGVHTPPLSCCDHETQQLAAELEDLQEQQASLDRRAAELREVLHALESTAGSRSPSEGQCGDAAAKQQATGAALEGWQRLAVDHNIREVQCAFTVGDEEAERKKSLADLVTRLAFVSATPIDALCFPIDVSGPVGLIAGLRLGLVPPYSGSSSSRGGSADGNVRGSGASAAFGLSEPPLGANGPGPLSDEGIHLSLFVHRQVSYAQLLLSGNTSAAGEDPTNSRSRGIVSDAIRGVDDSPWGGDGTAASAAAAAASAAPLAETHVNTRVSPGEVNAACGYLLQLINYLAHVNGFSFHTAILRPAGDRSTLTLLKRVPASSSAAAAPAPAAAAAGGGPGADGGGGGGEALLTTAASLLPFSLWSYFTRGDNVQTQSSGGERVAPTQKATAGFVWVEDHDVDFYITDRFLAWRTFGAACVAVAACVKELADALHESLRCWRVREGLVDQRATSASLRMTLHASTVASCDAAEGREAANSLPTLSADGVEVNDTINETEAQDNTDICLVSNPRSVPRSLPQLLQGLSRQVDALHVEDDLVKGSETHGSSCADDTRGKSAATSAKQGHHVEESASASANRRLPQGATTQPCRLPRSPCRERGQFSIFPPYQTRGDAVDGFSVRHGSVSEAIWTLGMKKLLANVQWCMEATLELERLYALH